MKTRTLLVVVLTLAIVAVALATCTPEGDAPHGHRDVDTAPATDTDGLSPEIERKPRRRIAGHPPPAEDGASERALSLPSEWVSADEVPAGHGPPPPSGTVHAVMLDADGEPFEGGHVCFYEDALFVEPGPWDGVESSDGAYFGLPHHKGMWPHFDPVLGSGRRVPRFSGSRGITGADGRATISVPADQRLVTFVRWGMSGIPLRSYPRVDVADGEEVEVTIQASRTRSVTGRCLDARGRPLTGVAVQALHALDERPLSRIASTSDAGEFALSVFGDMTSARVRAVVNYVAHPRGIYDREEDIPPFPADATVACSLPCTEPLTVHMPDAPLVILELTASGGQAPPEHLQIEGLTYDARMSAWGRLGGPQFRRTRNTTKVPRAIVGIPRTEAQRPLMLWSWGWTITSVDPRGQDRVTVEMPRGRRAGVRGTGWRATDRLRVVAFLGPPGRELPCVWIDGALGGNTSAWERSDAPVSEIEFQIVREGVVVGRSARVPAGTDAADDVTIDLQ